MSEKDFDLDIKITTSNNNEEVNITSISLCTEGCITSFFKTCTPQTTTCGCVVLN